ncbi:MAG: efflux RND transporter periplasmic adaptor subunit [Actinobacteria bacterium]|nr:efflux RND transporter periplasmic adaptor subunit [Actinomycetota bacterium]MBU2688894.1 efflux RND transporter periplasmic adaptor subunit [Actinomycetota bacterium]
MKVALAIVLLAAISAGCGASSATEVEVARVGPRSISETVMVAGTTQAASASQVIPQVYGPVAQVYVQEGQQVVAGQPLVQLDTSGLEQSLLSAEASLESTQSLASMVNGLSASAAGISSSINSALASVDAGVTNLYELERLLVPLLPEQQRLAALQAIEAGYQSYVAQASNRGSISTGGGGGMSTGAQEAAANKAIENARKNLAASTIVAPTTGTLVAVSGGGTSIDTMLNTLMSSFSGMMPSGLNLSSLSGLTGMSTIGMPTGGPPVAGTYVSPGAPIYSVVDLKNMTMHAKVDESDIAKIQSGQEAAVSLEAYPGKKYKGQVVKVADTATTNEAGATAFDVAIQMDLSDINLKIGMTGTADVTVASKKSATVVPVEAVVEKQGKKYVFKVVDGKARLTPITLGLVTDSDVEVVKGVKIGDYVVVKGTEKLKDGSGVKI